MKHLLSIILITFLFSFPLKAEINFETSIETNIVSADWIAEGTIKKIDTVEIDGQFTILCFFTKDSVLKGDEVPHQFEFYINCFYADRLDFDEVSHVIGFFEVRDDSIFVREDAWGDYPLLVDFDYFSDVYLFTAKGFREVKTKARLLSIIHDVENKTNRYLKSNSLADIETVWIEIPYESEIFGYLYGGSSCFLYVPDFLFPKATDDF